MTFLDIVVIALIIIGVSGLVSIGLILLSCVLMEENIKNIWNIKERNDYESGEKETISNQNTNEISGN